MEFGRSSPCRSVNGGVHSCSRTLVDIVSSGKKIIWNQKREDALIEKFKDVIRKKYHVPIETYWDLHTWSVMNIGCFWDEVMNFFQVILSKPHVQVLPRHGELRGTGWFRGMKFNLAENLLRYRDSHVALICLDEEGSERKFTYAEMFEEVKLYTAAFRKHGLKPGDIVAGYMSNREEAIFAMLGCASIGALWGGLVPLYGSKATAKLLQSIKPKFLFTVDQTREDNVIRNILENLSTVVNSIESIDKVIIVPTQKETIDANISGIKNSCFLQQFLEPGRSYPGGVAPELEFEQLPFDHPLSLNFTSGTTGTPKGVVHSAGALLGMLSYFGLLNDCTRNDIILINISNGWVLWNLFASILALGSTLMLFNGNPFFLSTTFYWDLIAKYKVSIAVMVTSAAERMEKMNIIPGSSCNLDSLRTIIIGGSPVKLNTFEFLLKKVKKNVLVGSNYGCTEIPLVAGFDSNSPICSGEIQSPMLGVDLRILDDSGNPVVGRRGEVVISSPHPYLPVYLLNDEGDQRLKTSYLSKFPAVSTGVNRKKVDELIKENRRITQRTIAGSWCMNDEGWIDPETKGIVIIGRRDNEFNSQDERFTSNDIYFAIEDVEEIVDSICVCQKSCKGYERAVLFVKLQQSFSFGANFAYKIKKKIKYELTEFHVPEIILEVKNIPYNVNGKKMEKLVAKIIETNEIPDVTSVRNPECLELFKRIPELQNY